MGGGEGGGVIWTPLGFGLDFFGRPIILAKAEVGFLKGNTCKSCAVVFIRRKPMKNCLDFTVNSLFCAALAPQFSAVLYIPPVVKVKLISTSLFFCACLVETLLLPGFFLPFSALFSLW